MGIYTANTKINIDLLKSTNVTSEVLDKGNVVPDTTKKPMTKGEIFHNRIVMVFRVIYIFLGYITSLFYAQQIVFLIRFYIKYSTILYNIELGLACLPLSFTACELKAAKILWYFIDEFSPKIKNDSHGDFNMKERFFYLLATPIALMMLTFAIIDMSTAVYIIQLTAYIFCPIGLGLLYSEIIKAGILTLIFPFIYKKEIRGKENGLFLYCRKMFIFWSFTLLAVYILLLLWLKYSQYYLNIDLKYFLIPTTYDTNSNYTIFSD
ncbi:hypothetical protein NEAUS04_1702 [Nematocida ausubeli]|nr:hypothetical protein NEAUS04_1702 [Nematocida ausubeli]